MQDSFKTLIDSAQDILILLPSKVFVDSVASGLSLYLSLTQAGKAVSISCSSDMVAEFSRLVGVDKVTKELGNKNLVIRFVNYDSEDVDKVKADVEDNKFTLTVVPKANKKAPTKEQIETNYSGGMADLVILVGGTNDSHFPELQNEDFKQTKIIHIGTKLLEIQSVDLEVLSFATTASSISEITANLINESAFPIDADIATNLLAGIEDKSNNFQSQETTATTFEVFAQLLKLGGRRMQKLSLPKYPQGAIPTKPYNAFATPKPVVTKQDEAVKTTEVKKSEDNNILQKTDEAQGVMTAEEAEKELEFDIPPSWSEPKIFTGTSIS